MKTLSMLVLFSAVQLISSSATAAENGGNLLQCEGKGFEVSYSSSSRTGEPQYRVQDVKNHVDINLSNRNEIRSTSTPMGRMITATYFRQALADGPTYLYSLVIPAHELGMAESLKLETQMIRTTVVCPFHPQGMSMQLQHSEVFSLTCEVQRVNF